MNVWDRITGKDLTRDWESFQDRAGALPADYRTVWHEMTAALLPHGSFTGRNLTPIMDGALTFFEDCAQRGEAAVDVIGEDVAVFVAALIGASGTQTPRDRWRRRLNSTVAVGLGREGG